MKIYFTVSTKVVTKNKIKKLELARDITPSKQIIFLPFSPLQKQIGKSHTCVFPENQVKTFCVLLNNVS